MKSTTPAEKTYAFSVIPVEGLYKVAVFELEKGKIVNVKYGDEDNLTMALSRANSLVTTYCMKYLKDNVAFDLDALRVH